MIRCTVCAKEWDSFFALRLIGFFAGFDANDRPVLIEQRNCTCEQTMSHVVSRARVELARNEPGKIGKTAATAIADLEFHEHDVANDDEEDDRG